MKIIICGKGGSGKSTLVSLLARQLAGIGKKVVVVDTDASNTGIHYLLGADEPQDFTGKFSDKKEMMEEMHKLRKQRGPHALHGPAPTATVAAAPLLGTWTFDTLPEKCTVESDGVKLVAMGKIQQSTEYGKGRWVGLTRQFLTGYMISDMDRVIIDTDAGVEHLARGMGAFCNLIIAVIDTSYESLLFVKTITHMAEQADLPLYFILNKTTISFAGILYDSISRRNLIIGELPFDRSVMAAGFTGIPLDADYKPAVFIVEKIEKIIAEIKKTGVSTGNASAQDVPEMTK
jgi:CO dehydrogenase maturation factor